jgi:hypothetical protein
MFLKFAIFCVPAETVLKQKVVVVLRNMNINEMYFVISKTYFTIGHIDKYNFHCLILLFDHKLKGLEQVCLQYIEENVRSASHEMSRLFGSRFFITAFLSAHQWTLSWARWFQSTSLNAISLRSILILSSHLRAGLPISLFLLGFPTNILYALSQ